MMYRNAWVLACCVTVLSFSTPARSQYAVFISGDGNDANNCATPATACRTVADAQTTVNAGGVIFMLPGEYGGAVITKSVKIIAEAGHVSMTTSVPFVDGVGANIVINAGPTDIVRVRGIVSLLPTVTASGVAVLSAEQVFVENCTFVNGNNAFGLVFRPSANAALVVSDTTISGNTAGGIEVRPGAGATATINNTRVLTNRIGLEVFPRSTVTVRSSTIANSLLGIRARGSGVVGVADSTVSGNGTGLAVAGAGQIISHRGNVLFGNTTDGAFTSAINQQ